MTGERAAAARRLRAAAGVATAALSVGCTTPLRVTPLATGQVSVAAYELRGDDSERLRAEAVRLCGGTADVLRDSAGSRSVPAADDAGQWSRLWTRAQQWGQPAQREAQLVVRCAASPERERAVARYTPAVAAPKERSWWSSLVFWRKGPDAATNDPTAEPGAVPSDWSVNFE